MCRLSSPGRPISIQRSDNRNRTAFYPRSEYMLYLDIAVMQLLKKVL